MNNQFNHQRIQLEMKHLVKIILLITLIALTCGCLVGYGFMIHWYRTVRQYHREWCEVMNCTSSQQHTCRGCSIKYRVQTLLQLYHGTYSQFYQGTVYNDVCRFDQSRCYFKPSNINGTLTLENPAKTEALVGLIIMTILIAILVSLSIVGSVCILV